jgi:threonine dehydrogenase-like Zn-dependent dehydrogenase
VCGNSDVIENGIKLLKPGGAYMLVGMVHPKSQLNITGEQIIRKCLTIKGIHNYQGYHLKNAVEFLKNNIAKYPFETLVSKKVFTLDQLPEAIELAKLKNDFRIAIKP